MSKSLLVHNAQTFDELQSNGFGVCLLQFLYACVQGAET
jgi:hypothetical protein